MKKRVALIIPYFGKWPEWIELYFYSCGRNPMVDFIFYTDCPLPLHQYENTIFHQCSYENYCKLISERLGIDFSDHPPYKLCDMKPFYGFIHEKELTDYEFWGFGDLDLVYGDLSMLINEENLKRYELITTHNYQVAGHFTICRNNEYYRNLCFHIEGWKEGLCIDKYIGYDEAAWSNLACPHERNIGRLYHYVLRHLGKKVWEYRDRINAILMPRLLLREFWTCPQPTFGQEWVYDLTTGHVTDHIGRELPYLHFLFFKKTRWLETDKYWRDDYFQLAEPIENYKKITIDYQKITGIK